MTGDHLRQGEPLLVEITSGVGIKVIPLTGHRINIGRSHENTIILDDLQVSRKHAQLSQLSTGGWSVSDLNSRNGTLVNGIRVGIRPVAFRIGDEITIGSSTIRVRNASCLPVESETLLKSATDAPGSNLSPRETSVLRLVAEGCTDAEIAARLTISVKTVHSHLDSIRDKTGVRRRPELIRVAQKLGLS